MIDVSVTMASLTIIEAMTVSSFTSIIVIRRHLPRHRRCLLLLLVLVVVVIVIVILLFIIIIRAECNGNKKIELAPSFNNF